MSATEHLSGEQFKAYRGLYLGPMHKATFIPPPQSHSGIGHHEFHPTDPHDTEAILKHHLRQMPEEDRTSPYKENWPIYGQHWTPYEDTAVAFAHDPTHAARVPAGPGKNPSYGVVLEAHTSEPPTRSAHSHYESQVNLPRRIVKSVTAHLYHNEGGPLPRDWKTKNLVRSFEVPEEHWRNA